MVDIYGCEDLVTPTVWFDYIPILSILESWTLCTLMHSFVGCYSQNFGMIIGYVGHSLDMGSTFSMWVAWNCVLGNFEALKIDGELSTWCQNCMTCLVLDNFLNRYEAWTRSAANPLHRLSLELSTYNAVLRTYHHVHAIRLGDAICNNLTM